LVAPDEGAFGSPAAAPPPQAPRIGGFEGGHVAGALVASYLRAPGGLLRAPSLRRPAPPQFLPRAQVPADRALALAGFGRSAAAAALVASPPPLPPPPDGGE
jgi:hypothetical protein